MSAPVTRKPAPAHQQFAWLTPQKEYEPAEEFVALTMDICMGMSTVLELAHASTLDQLNNPDNRNTALMNQNETDRLMRLLTATVGLLTEKAEANIEHINKRRERAQSNE